MILDLVIATLAASRLTRLVVHDFITEKAREWVWKRWPGGSTVFGDSEVKENGTDALGYKVGSLSTGVEVFRSAEGWHPTRARFVGNLIECHWCTGVWMAVVVWAVVWFYPVAVPFLAALAIAEVIGLLNDR